VAKDEDSTRDSDGRKEVAIDATATGGAGPRTRIDCSDGTADASASASVAVECAKADSSLAAVGAMKQRDEGRDSAEMASSTLDCNAEDAVASGSTRDCGGSFSDARLSVSACFLLRYHSKSSCMKSRVGLLPSFASGDERMGICSGGGASTGALLDNAMGKGREAIGGDDDGGGAETKGDDWKGGVAVTLPNVSCSWCCNDGCWRKIDVTVGSANNVDTVGEPIVAHKATPGG